MDPARHNALILALKKGEKSAYKEIYDDFFGVMYHLSYQYLHDELMAEEIVQDTFLKLWEIRKTLNERFNVRNYLYTLTKNSCLNCLRNQRIAMKHQKNILYLEVQYNEMALEKLGSYLEYDELLQRVDQTISMLPEEIKSTFLLSRDEGFSYKKIAEIQSVSVKTIEARISKVLKILRLELRDYLTILWLFFSFYF
ncbi:MAG: RNA polymerase sigma-70 factor [Prolixibacteraceae bacterium]|jgi:RNA polymerase sigma-70 factor, ECF subfamily